MPLALVACVDTGDEAIFVLNNSAVSGTSCSLSGSPDQPQNPHGTLNVSSPAPYVMTPLVQSRLVATMDGDDVARTVQLRGADVSLTVRAITVQNASGFNTTQPNKALAPMSVLFAGSIKPGGSLNAAVNTISPSQVAEIITLSGANLATDVLEAEVEAQVVIKGELNGSGIETQPFFFPVTVCNNCVIASIKACPLPASPAPRQGNPCNPFQDGVVDCCVDGSTLICPGTTAAM